jgi:hypothetical protein
VTAQTAILLACVAVAAAVIVAQTLAITKLMDERQHLNDEWRRALDGWDRALDAERAALEGWGQAMDDHERTLNAIDRTDPP